MRLWVDEVRTGSGSDRVVWLSSILKLNISTKVVGLDRTRLLPLPVLNSSTHNTSEWVKFSLLPLELTTHLPSLC